MMRFVGRGSDTIVFHHSGSDDVNDRNPRVIKKLHTGKTDEWITYDGKPMKCRGWQDIGYHFFIDRYSIYQCRSILMDGAHIKGHNENKIAICIAGKTYAILSKSFYSAKHLVDRIIRQHKKQGESIDNITCHRHYAETQCPDFSPISDIIFGQKIDPKNFPKYFLRSQWDKT